MPVRVEVVPIRIGDNGVPIVEFDFEDCEIIGLVKFDVLTLRTLDTIQLCMDLVAERHGEEIMPDDWVEEYKDPDVWNMLAEGNTLDVFQVETYGGTRLCKEVAPTNLFDLSDIIALDRPGPMRSGLKDQYLRRRQGRERIEYADPRLKSVLDRTFACIIYQEDVMAVCQVLAGWTLQQADDMRRILGKKKAEAIEHEEEKFIKGCAKMKVEKQAAQRTFDQMREFAKYSCVTGDTLMSLASSGPSSDGTAEVGTLHRRLSTPLHPPVRGRTPLGQEYRGPCVICGTAATPEKRVRGACNACYVWRQKFNDAHRGLHALAVHADGRIRPCRVRDVVQAGEQSVWCVTLADGRSIAASSEQAHLTERGPIRVDDLVLGEHLLVDGGYEVHRYDPSNERTTVGERRMTGAVLGHHGRHNFGYINGGFAALQEWTEHAPDHCERCGHDGSVRRLERAHLDGDRTNNEPANLRMLCVSCHKRHDYQVNGRRRRWQKGHLALTERIVSIECVGTKMTYDVVMDEPRNFIANGIATSGSHTREQSDWHS